MTNTAINFHKPTLKDKTWVDEVLKSSRHRGCFYTFAQLFAWSCMYNTYIARHKNAFLAIGCKGETPLYIYPAGTYDITEIVQILKKDAEARGADTLKFVAIEPFQKEELEQFFPGEFEFFEMRDSADYLYNADDLINLPGKKYHKKRNHISQANRKYPNWEYEALSQDNLRDFLECALSWKLLTSDGKPEFEADFCALDRSLRHFGALGLIGGAIRIGEKIVAFTLGERLNDDTFVIHFEKALPEFAGCYPLINREFAARNLSGYAYINREEDMGIEGLRKAKLSYYPETILMKYFAVMKQK